MQKEQLIWAAGIKAMAGYLTTEVNKLREIRKQAYGMLRNGDIEERAIAQAKIIEMDRTIKEWRTAYKKMVFIPDFSA